jgi:hypothetical protein
MLRSMSAVLLIVLVACILSDIALASLLGGVLWYLAWFHFIAGVGGRAGALLAPIFWRDGWRFSSHGS